MLKHDQETVKGKKTQTRRLLSSSQQSQSSHKAKPPLCWTRALGCSVSWRGAPIPAQKYGPGQRGCTNSSLDRNEDNLSPPKNNKDFCSECTYRLGQEWSNSIQKHQPIVMRVKAQTYLLFLFRVQALLS